MVWHMALPCSFGIASFILELPKNIEKTKHMHSKIKGILFLFKIVSKDFAIITR
jgi:hypothetical protein